MNDLDKSIFNYYEKLASNYQQDRFANSYGQFINTQEESLLRVLLAQKQCVLDLACGTGRFMHLAHEGLDVSPAMLKETAKIYVDKPLHCSSAWEIPTSDIYYDAIFSMHLLMHLTKVRFQDILTEAHRVLQPNGLFIFDVPAAWRRKILNYREDGWHGNTAYTIKEIKTLIGNEWEFIDYNGILLLPIHHVPKAIRGQFIGVDSFLSKHFFKYFASYYLIVLQKRQ